MTELLNTKRGQTLLAIADSKLVLGNWYAECTGNGRALPEFAALLGMSGASFGHARALYRQLAPPPGYAALERGRNAEQIASMELLDAAPQDWEDFIVSTWLAEIATWQMMSGFLDDPERSIAGLARRVGQEGYFHLRYFAGWLAVMGEDPQRAERVARHFDRRWPRAAQWLSDEEGKTSRLFAAVEEVACGADRLGRELATPIAAPGPGWDFGRRRHGPLPDRLFEVIRFKDPALAH